MIDLKAIQERADAMASFWTHSSHVQAFCKNDVPALLAEVERLRKALQQVQSCSDPEISDMIEKVLHE